MIWKHVIGIVGGLGPHAHLELERSLLNAAKRLIGDSIQDQDYPEWILSSIPSCPDRTLALTGKGATPLESLKKSISRLREADFAVIACNTAHAFLDDLRDQVSIPLLDMIGETARHAMNRVGRSGSIGILATSGTLQSGLYDSALETNGFQGNLISLRDLNNGDSLQEELVMSPIYGPIRGGMRRGGGIKSGIPDDLTKETLANPLRQAVRLLANAGAQIVIMACTEIPLALGRAPVEGVPLLDSIEVVASSAIEIAAGVRPLEIDFLHPTFRTTYPDICTYVAEQASQQSTTIF